MRRELGLVCLLAALLVVASALAACAKPTPTPVPPTPVPTATMTPLPSATPLPPQPPRVLRRVPERGEEQAPDAPVVLYFDQEMDTPSVETAFHIEPAVQGKLSWEDPRTLRFSPPSAGFARDTEYHISLETKAHSSRKLALAHPVEFRFRTVGYLEVTNVSPLPDSVDVADQGAIRVMFNRPVVPMTSIAEQTGLPQPLEFTPPIKGKGSWTNTSIYTFEPTERLLPGTRYKAVVRQGLRDTTGGVLASDYVWSFTTALPDVVSVTPKHKAQYVPQTSPVSVTFSQPMQHEGAQARFTLLHAKTQQAVPGSFQWDGQTMSFAPTKPLEMGAQYQARLEKGSPAATSEATIAKTYAWQFTVVSQPRLTAFRPQDRQTNVELTGDAIKLTFSSPISEAAFIAGFIITPTSDFGVYWEQDNTVANVGTYLRPSTQYTITLTTRILGRYGHPLQEGKTIHFRTRPLNPTVQLDFQNPGVFSAYGKPVAYVSHVNVSRIDLALYTLSVDDFVALNGEDAWKRWDDYRGQEGALLRRWSLAVHAPLNASQSVSVTLTEADGQTIAPGLYYLEASAPEAQHVDKRVVVVSDTNLTLKNTQNEVLVWATDLRDAQPIPGVSISVYDGKGRQIAKADTDQDGVAQASVALEDSWAPLVVLGRRGDGIAAVLRNWSSGLGPWDFNLPSSFGLEKYNAFFYTDRRIYRPGQKVYYKGILRVDNDAQYSLPPTGDTVQLKVSDGQGRDLWQGTAQLSDMGTVHGEFQLGMDAALGNYFLQAKYGEQYFGIDFQVAEYRKPEFQASVTLDKADYIQGDTIQASVEASYFFGGALDKAPVHWRVMRQPWFFDRWHGKEYYDFTDTEDYLRSYFVPFGEVVTEGEGQTDAQGRFTFSVPANIKDLRQSQLYTLEASIVDVNNQEVSARSSAVVHKGTFYIGLAPTSYVGTAGREVSVRAITVDTQGLTRTQQSLEVVFSLREWFSVKEKTGNGEYWTNKVQDTPVATQTVKTDGLGTALASFTPPKGGTYRVVARGLDERENEVRSSTFLWVSDREWVNWGQENHDRINLVADKKSYRPGETAQILIPSPYQGKVTALLTIERGHVLEHRLLDIESNSQQLSLPILPEYAPNVYVSVVIVKGVDTTNPVASFKVGYVMLSVSTEQKELKITITPDRTGPYKPRDKVTYAIEVKNYQGRGVEAELSLNLVDLAVESLAGADTRDIVQWFYRERGLGVATAATLAFSVDRQNLEKAATGKGGGGGEEGMVRQNFADTAFWAPTVRTDSSGRATVSVDLPDNLTTWRMRAQAATAQTEVGKAQADVVANLDLMVRPVVPRFMVIGDKPTLGAVVHNNTAQDLELTVSLGAEGLSLAGGPQSVTVPAHGRKSVSWNAVVSPTQEAVLRFRATGGQYSDAVELRLPVYHLSSPEVVGTSGEVEDQTIELVRLPESIDPTLGELSVQLEPSLAAGMREGLEYLRSYPYDCIEQTVSRFLPNVVTYRALRKLGVQDAELEAQLPQQVGVALQRIYSLQNLDGGWGWWHNEDSSPILTAYVVFGLTEAQQAEFAVDQDVLERGVGYLRSWLEQEPDESRRGYDARATVLYTLAEAGFGDLGRTVSLFEHHASMSLYARAYMAMTFHILAPSETSRVSTLINEMANAAIVSATGAHWEEKEADLWAMNTDLRTTAIVLRALVRLQPNNALLPNAVRWLMTARNSGRWETTQENVWAILALTDRMVATGELTADYSYGLWLNGVSQASGTVSPTTVDKPIRSQFPISALRLEGDNDLIFERTATGGQKGTGKLYYSAFLRYFLPAEQLRPLNRGIIVDRQYYLVSDLKKAVTQANVNDVVVVNLTLVAPNDLYFLVLEDPLPAGCEAIDTSLKTTSAAAQGPELGSKEGKEKPQVDREWPGEWYWASHSELRDEKVALFASFLPKGTYVYTYSLRCTTPGEFKVMPATAYEMYFADVFGRSGGTSFSIAAAQ